MSVLEAYEKMLEDGSANIPIKISQPTPTNPSGNVHGGNADPLSIAEGKGKPLGDPVRENRPPEIEETPEPDYSTFDSQMEEYIKRKRAARANENTTSATAVGNIQFNGSQEIARINKRLEMIENTLGLIMETHKLILEKGNV